MGGKDSFPGFVEFMNALPKETRIFIHPSNSQSRQAAGEFNRIPSGVSEKLFHFMSYGGEENWRNMFLYLSNMLKGTSFTHDPPMPLPWEGIYHPDTGVVTNPEEYISQKVKLGKPTVGVWFHRGTWVSGNTDYIDALVREIEDQGANAIPVFLQLWRDEELGSLGAEEVVRKFFMKDGGPLIDCLISCMMFSITMRVVSSEIVEKECKGILEELGVPVIEAVVSSAARSEWESSIQGLNPVTLSIGIVMPEFDGNLISVPVAFKERSEVDGLTGARIIKHVPHNERIKRAVSLAVRWANLRHIPDSRKRIAILFHNYPPGNGTIGSAYLLDSVKSVWNILQKLRENGYDTGLLPENDRALIDDILDGSTHDARWNNYGYFGERKADARLFMMWHKRLPDERRKEMAGQWGKPPGEINVYNGDLIIPGKQYGNIFVGIQPSRGFFDDPGSVYHSPDIPPPHSYYAYYSWIRDVFKADAILHIGKHGSLEWLPGKGVGLSEACYPDIMISDLPHIYPYIINNPGEGMQAKRRSAACIIDHLVPVMDTAGTYGDLEELEKLIQDYSEARLLNPGKLDILRTEILDKIESSNINEDLNCRMEELDENFPEVLNRLHRYIQDIKYTQVRNGLHCFGEAPAGEGLVKFLFAITRLPNGSVPSLPDILMKIKQYPDGSNGSKAQDNTHRENLMSDDIHTLSLQLLRAYQQEGFREVASARISRNVVGSEDKDLLKILRFISNDVVPRLMKTGEELTHTLDALEGRFVPPGPSGAPTRGMAHILPTGRNFYSVDPNVIPGAASWKVGKSLADGLLERYKREQGNLPEHVGIVVWASPTMRTKGDDIAEILCLLGVKPVWNSPNGYVRDLEVIPLEELGRPRIDVTCRISGLFRDAFPSLVSLIEKAINLVAFLDERDEDNYIVKHMRHDMKELIGSGSSEDEARELSLYRIFGAKPGAYGAGVNHLIDNKNWENDDDIAQVYLNWGGWAYGKKKYGVQLPERFKLRLSTMDVAVKNVDHRESDIMDSDDYYQYHGGMAAAIRVFRGKDAENIIGDSSNPERVVNRTAAEEAKRVFRTRILNPKWIDSMKRHGYKGAMDAARSIDYAFGWDATSHVIDDWMYEDIAKTYLFNNANKDWLKEDNPYAFQSIVERLLEAFKRGLWDADDSLVEKLKELYLDVEGLLEEKHE